MIRKKIRKNSKNLTYIQTYSDWKKPEKKPIKIVMYNDQEKKSNIYTDIQ